MSATKKEPAGAGGKGRGSAKPPARDKKPAGDKKKSKGSGGLLLLLLSLVVACFAVLALDLQTVETLDLPGSLRPGDHVLLDKLSAELGRVSQGEVVAVRSRTRGRMTDPLPLLRQVVATAGEQVQGRTVERGHLLISPARASKGKFEQVPVGDVLAVARVRIREKGERWAVDPLP